MRNQFGVGVREGDVVDGKYRIEAVLGKGGMGVVFAALHVQLNQRVAIKVLLPEVLSYPEVVERFAREARAAVQIRSEHVTRVLDVGTLPNGAPYMVMEFLNGTDLAVWLDDAQPMAIELAAEFLLQACEAIAEAHSLGIVHRDLKPENLFCVERPDGGLSVKVLDFGISKVTHDSAGVPIAKLTAVGLLGTPRYASPEQIASAHDVDARTDIWSLGVVLFRLLTKHMPFNDLTGILLYARTSTEQPPSMRAYRPDIPPALDEVVATCLGKHPHQRYANIAEFASALARFAPPRAQSSVERIFGVLGMRAQFAASQLPVTPGTLATGNDSVVVPMKPRSIFVVIAAVLLLLLLGAVGLVVVLLREKAPTESALPTAASAASTVPLVTTTPSVALPVPVPVPTPAAVAVPVESAAKEPAPVSTLALPSARPPRPATPTFPAVPVPVTRPTAAPPPVVNVAKPPSSNCTPPYTLDAKGRKHFKAECFAQ